jgi:Proteasome complex subunit Rpn13 ubiquitin receptor
MIACSIAALISIAIHRRCCQLVLSCCSSTSSLQVVDDVLVMPSEIEFKKVDTGKAGDRVYVLQIKGSSRRFLYWMQDKSADKVSMALARCHSVQLFQEHAAVHQWQQQRN